MSDRMKRQKTAATSKFGRGCSSAGPAATAQAGAEVANDSELRAKVRDLLQAEDPVNINYGGGAEAYAPDINAIVERLGKCRNAQAVCSVIFDELCQSFGPEAVGPREDYLEIAKRLWELHTTHRERR
jgi:hypothetical protein